MTGSGKTLGFVLPALIHIQSQSKIISQAQAYKNNTLEKGAAGPIVLSPTRELALQTNEVFEKAAPACGFRSICIYGGVDKNIQRQALKQGVEIMIATPGRLLGSIREGIINLKRVTFLVLDEADRMLDLGFEPDIRAIIKAISGDNSQSKDRQTLMFSATWPEIIQKLAHEFITNPVHITIGKENAADLKANTRVKQTIEVIEDRARDGRLIELLKDYHKSRNNRILIFVLYKKEVDRVERFLINKGFNARGISGDKNQSDRTQAIEQFKSGTCPLLIATDVAARGLDIKNVEYVINYSFPLTVEDYIHRIGRTGRGGLTGISHTFFTKNDKHLSGELINVLNEAKETVPAELLKFGTGVKRKEHAMYGAHFKPPSGGDEPMKKAVRMTFD
jgi:ATP-dependent RNA helicase DBP3